MAPRVRADQLAFEQGLAESRERAKRSIMAGEVFLVRGHERVRIDKPGQQLQPEAVLALRKPERFVSRGAYKLLTAIERFGLDFTGQTVLDAGASTGGFTDCLLQHGAIRVFAVDVGHGQLHERLRTDPRVTSLEGVNLRQAPPDLLPWPVDAVVADVSFISLTKILPACLQWLRPGGRVVALIKPQFELGPEANIKGVVRDEGLRQRAIALVTDFAVRQLGLVPEGVEPSRITGPKGNQEYLALFRRSE